MSTMELLKMGFGVVFEPSMFIMVCIAIVLGTVFGALPGVSATMAVALGLTFTYTMEPIPAIVFLVAIYCSSITGGSITAILFKIPGVPSSAPTTFDGYPMAQRGEAGKALGVALFCSAVGGLVSALAMFLLSGPLTQAALQFGPADLFSVTFLGLSILTCLDGDHILTTIISGLIGLLLACVGQDKMYAVQRLTFGSMIVSNILMVIVAIGIAKVFAQILAIPYSYLGPIIVMLALIGAYANQMSISDVQIMVLAGVMGVIIKACHFNSAAIVLGLVLGSMCESNFSRAYLMSKANVGLMFSPVENPIAFVLIIMCFVMLVTPVVMPMLKKAKK